MNPNKSLTIAEIDERLLEEKRIIVRDLLAEVWEAGIDAGIEPSFMAEEFIHATIEELSAMDGLEGSEKLISRLSVKLMHGLLPVPRVLQ